MQDQLERERTEAEEPHGFDGLQEAAAPMQASGSDSQSSALNNHTVAPSTLNASSINPVTEASSPSSSSLVSSLPPPEAPSSTIVYFLPVFTFPSILSVFVFSIPPPPLPSLCSCLSSSQLLCSFLLPV